MAIRTTAAEVRNVIDTDPDISMDIFISAANVLTDKVNTCATNKGETLTTNQLKYIETYLAAHFYAKRDPQYKSKRTADASATFQTTMVGKRFESTDWGSAAIELDTSGCLRAMQSGSKALFKWLGKPDSDQIDYDDRD